MAAQLIETAPRADEPAPAGRWRAFAIDPGARWIWLAAALVSAVWALVLATNTWSIAYHIWGTAAAIGYGAALIAGLVLPRRRVPFAVTGFALAGAVVAPLGILAATGHAQSEVWVVERSAQLLLHTGAVYAPNPPTRDQYDPYLPGMSVFGLPSQWFGRHSDNNPYNILRTVLGDARIWFALVFVGCVLASWWLLQRQGTRTAGEPRHSMLAPLALIASPLVSFSLCVSGVDLPMIGLACLALAFAARGYGLPTGIAAALTCWLKWTVWPLVPVVVVLVFMRRGWRRAVVCAVVAVGWTIVSILPFALHAGHAMLDQVVRFPLGLADVRTPAASPLPGHLLADLGWGGRLVGLLLLAAAAVAAGVWTIRRPPHTAIEAVNRFAVGVGAVFVFAPSNRFGYFALPIIVWLLPHLANGGLQITVPRLPRARDPARHRGLVLTIGSPRPVRPADEPGKAG